jgi:hypothetical protein
MRISMVGALFLLAGAGAATTAAAVGTDTTGSGASTTQLFHLNGSDTLHDVTVDVMNGCGTTFPDFGAQNLTYDGGGSGVGAGQMDLGAQAISPMSRALNGGSVSSIEWCAITASVYSSNTAAADPAATEALLVGIDGVTIAANTTTSCSSTAATQIGASTAFTVTNDGTSTGGTPATCPGCVSNTYLFGDTSVSTNIYQKQPSFDALAVLYFGLTHDGTYNCASPVRKSLIKNWNNLFAGGCSGNCSNGLTHAWRRSDLAGTTDAFVSVLAPPKDSAGNKVGIGTLSTVPAGATQKANPFCNAPDHNQTPPVVSFAGSGDFSDLDPVRTNCQAPEATVPPDTDNGTATGNPILSTNTEDVCAAFKNFATSQKAVGGDLGVVQTILVPDEVSQIKSEWYPAVPCSGSCTLVQVAKNLPANFLCPNGQKPYTTQCYMPFAGSSSSPDPRCVSGPNNTCVDTVGKRDGRTYNLVTIVAGSEIQNSSIKKIALDFAGGPYQFALDANVRLLTGSYYRMHSVNGSDPVNTTFAPHAATGFGICQENDDTSQIGCLVDSDTCSVGYAGRKSANSFPDAPGGGTQSKLKALTVNGEAPFTLPTELCPTPTNPTATCTDPDIGLKNLLAPSGTTPLYPLARRLYFATLYGFDKLQGGEAELAKCYGNTTTTGGYLTTEGFVADPNGVECLDYPETGATATPLPNTQGGGNVALSGCATGTEHNACTGHPLTGTNVQVCGNGVLEGSEACDPPTGLASGQCGFNCQVNP